MTPPRKHDSTPESPTVRPARPPGDAADSDPTTDVATAVWAGEAQVELRILHIDRSLPSSSSRIIYDHTETVGSIEAAARKWAAAADADLPPDALNGIKQDLRQRLTTSWGMISADDGQIFVKCYISLIPGGTATQSKASGS